LKIIRIWCGEGGEHHKQQYCDELHHFLAVYMINGDFWRQLLVCRQNKIHCKIYIRKRLRSKLNDDELEWNDGGIWLFIAIDQDLDERQKNKISNITFNFTKIKCYILLYFLI
jgi:hypothetical protein